MPEIHDRAPVQPEKATHIGQAIVPAKVTERVEVAVPDGTSPTGASVSIAAVTPTQVRRPWRSTARTIFQATIAIAGMWAIIVQTLGLPDWAWVGTSIAVAGAITRLMSLPGVETFLKNFLPWLAAAPKIKDS